MSLLNKPSLNMVSDSYITTESSLLTSILIRRRQSWSLLFYRDLCYFSIAWFLHWQSYCLLSCTIYCLNQHVVCYLSKINAVCDFQLCFWSRLRLIHNLTGQCVLRNEVCHLSIWWLLELALLQADKASLCCKTTMLRHLIEHVCLWHALRCRGLVHQRLLFLQTLRLSVCTHV